ncbi:MAG: hypothetical protein BWY86_00947 [Candidatus Aminicenantes bacterium ADurb.Bin508]|nr:MAG: hypothetical protein BWY86_00947 [Candidatus Aminicenantes bacterium ADurb.Bin508]
MKPHLVHEAVEEEGGTGQVAGIFQNGHHQEEGDHIGDDDPDGAHGPGHDTIGQPVEPWGDGKVPHPEGQLVQRRQGEGFQKVPDPKDQGQHQEEDHNEEKVTKEGVAEEGIHPFGKVPSLTADDSAGLLGKLHGEVVPLREEHLL